MGMNMVSKGVQNVLDFLQNDFPDMDVIGVSGMQLRSITSFLGQISPLVPHLTVYTLTVTTRFNLKTRFSAKSEYFTYNSLYFFC